MLKIRSRLFSSSRLLFRKYTPDHEWIEIKGGIGTFGITDYAQKGTRNLIVSSWRCSVYRSPCSWRQICQERYRFSYSKDQIGAVESVKAASDIYAPVSGSVVEINEKLVDEPSLINSSAFENGWIAKIKLSKESEVGDLLDEKAYSALIAE